MSIQDSSNKPVDSDDCIKSFFPATSDNFVAKCGAVAAVKASDFEDVYRKRHLESFQKSWNGKIGCSSLCLIFFTLQSGQVMIRWSVIPQRWKKFWSSFHILSWLHQGRKKSFRMLNDHSERNSRYRCRSLKCWPYMIRYQQVIGKSKIL